MKVCKHKFNLIDLIDVSYCAKCDMNEYGLEIESLKQRVRELEAWIIDEMGFMPENLQGKDKP